MNPLTNMRNVKKLSEQELYTNNRTSWHDQYRDSAWVFIGGLPFDLTEGDIICIFSQYGEIVNINLIRDKDSGKSKGFCFLCYEDQRSTILAVDNLNGIKILNRTIRVDHVSNYKVPKDGKKTDEETKNLYKEGCAPIAEPLKKQEPVKKPVPKRNDDFRETIADQIEADIKLPARLPIYSIKTEPDAEIQIKVEKTDEPESTLKRENETEGERESQKFKNKKRSHSKDKEIDSDNEAKERERKKQFIKDKEKAARKLLLKKKKKIIEEDEKPEDEGERKRESSIDRHYVPKRYR